MFYLMLISLVSLQMEFGIYLTSSYSGVYSTIKVGDAVIFAENAITTAEESTTNV